MLTRTWPRAPACRILLKHQSVTSWEDHFLKIESNDSRVPTRRDVLKQSFAAGAAISLPWIVSSRALGRAGMAAASERITLGVIAIGP